MGEPDQDPQVTKREIKLSAEIARLRQRVKAVLNVTTSEDGEWLSRNEVEAILRPEDL